MKMSHTGKHTKTKKNIKLKPSVCFLCKKSGKIKAFTKTTLIKCRKIMESSKTMKHRDIELPTSLHQKGYHIACYNSFIGLKKYEIEPLSDPTHNDEQGRISEDTSSTSNADKKSAEISMPKPIEIPNFKAELKDNLDIFKTQDIKKEFVESVDKIPTMENQFSTFTNYLDPDISKAVILKSILTRKSPVKRDMPQDSLAFSYEFANQASSNFTISRENIQPKIVNTISRTDKGVCMFCNKEERKIGMKREFTIKSEEVMHEKVLSWAKNLYDYDLIQKLKNSQSFTFHALCKTEYRYKLEKLTRKNCDDDDWAVFKNLHAEAFDSLCAFIDDKIIDNHKTYFLSDLHERYKALLYEIQNSTTPFNFDSYTPQNLQEKIINTYYGIIEITTSRIFKRKIVYKSESKDNFDSAVVENDDLKYDKLAFELRSAIKSVKRRSECINDTDIPDKLFKFVGALIQGPDIRRMNSTGGYVRIKSMCKKIMADAVKEE